MRGSHYSLDYSRGIIFFIIPHICGGLFNMEDHRQHILLMYFSQFINIIVLLVSIIYCLLPLNLLFIFAVTLIEFLSEITFEPTL